MDKHECWYCGQRLPVSGIVRFYNDNLCSHCGAPIPRLEQALSVEASTIYSEPTEASCLGWLIALICGVAGLAMVYGFSNALFENHSHALIFTVAVFISGVIIGIIPEFCKQK